MIQQFDCDREWREIVDASPAMGALPRQTEYGEAPGLVPYCEAYPDMLVREADNKEVIEYCRAQQIFSVYHQHATWAPPGFQWNQNGLGYCWAWGVGSAIMDCRAREGKPTVLVSPVSLGWLVGWRNRGNYLESAMQGMVDRGMCSMEFTPDPHSLAYRDYKDGWEDDAMNYRIAEAWDASPRDMIQHALSILRTGTPLYIAYDWWGHALECCGIRWDESKTDNIVWQIRNSHKESDIIELTGRRGIPDEAYGIRASLAV